MPRAFAALHPPGQRTGNKSENLLNYNRFAGQGKIFHAFRPPPPKKSLFSAAERTSMGDNIL